MIESCRNCEKYASCNALCDRVLNILSKLGGGQINTKEVLEADLRRADKEGDTASLFDKLRKIDPGKSRSYDDDRDIQWDKYEYVDGDLTLDDFKNLRRQLEICVHDKKIRRRFYIFLGCDSMTTIAARAGVSKQMIHKQFAQIIQKVQGRLAMDRNTPSDTGQTVSSPRILTPHIMKKRYSAVQ